jgi:hypothetical protein
MTDPSAHVSLVGVLALLLPVLTGCASANPAPRGASRPSTVYDSQIDEQLILRVAARMQANVDSLCQLGIRGSARQPSYLLPRELDLMERTLTEYLACRDELQRISLECPAHSNSAGLHELAIARRTQGDIALASAALDNSVLQRALNQEFHRSGIPSGTCDRIMDELTDSNLVRMLPSSGPDYVFQTAAYSQVLRDRGVKDAREQIDEIVRRRSLLLPAVENELWHWAPTRFLATTGNAASSQFHRCRGALVAGFARIKNPAARSLEFTQAQREQVRGSLEPGDVLLTYSAGFASNLFIPGTFKHAATFVGTEDDRRRAGFPADILASRAGPNSQRLSQVLQQTKLTDGEPTDVVESLAEGVILNHFDRILTTRVSRLVVLRPRLNAEERALQLVDVLSFVGDEYDFSFDLTDASDQVCTEVVYRSLHGRGGISFPLTKHAGRFTLTADEILKYHLEEAGQFECILIVDEDPRSAGKAIIRFADEGLDWIKKLPGMGTSALPAG